MILPPELSPDDPPPGAGWYKQLLDFVRSCRVVPGRDSGLNAVSGPNGTSLAVAFPPIAYLGITTSAITARSGKTPGTGTVQPYGWNGTLLYLIGAPVTVRNWTGSSVATNVWVEYNMKYNTYWFNGNDCSGVAP